jgi:hypothetical protein
VGDWGVVQLDPATHLLHCFSLKGINRSLIRLDPATDTPNADVHFVVIIRTPLFRLLYLQYESISPPYQTRCPDNYRS